MASDLFSTKILGFMFIILNGFLLCLSESDQKDPNLIRPKEQLVFLGFIEGKTFLAELEQTMNWTSAKEYCNRSGLSLASIDTPEQLQFLVSSFARLDLPTTTNFWINARESRHPTMMVWDDNNQLPQFLQENWEFLNSTAAYHYCAEMTYLVGGTTKFFTLPCYEERFLLCQGQNV